MGIEMRGEFDFSGLLARTAAVLPEALLAGGEVIKTAAVEKAPKDSGDLIGGAAVNPAASDAGRKVRITFDGPYARYQHEHLAFKHPTGGQAKFLEAAMVEKTDDAMQEIAGKIRDGL
jgi:hypothetical protein